METDASLHSFSAVLSQDKEGMRTVIVYASRRMQPTEQNMGNDNMMELELLALKWAISDKFMDFHYYLFWGHPVEVGMFQNMIKGGWIK